MIYGYCRISRKTQNIERQERNIKELYPAAVIVKEAYTGTKLEGRKQLENLIKRVKAGDVIVFDSASRMSRNASEAIELYQQLYNEGVNLVFIKEPHINTDTYRDALQRQISVQTATGNEATDNFVKATTDALNRYTMDLAKEQIQLVFLQAQKEVDDLHQRTKEGIETARLHGKQIGQLEGRKLNVKKSAPAKEIIRKYNKDFGGQLNDIETIKLAGIARGTYYKYKKELLQEVC